MMRSAVAWATMVVVTTVLYLAVSITCVLALPVEELAGSETPLAVV